MLILIIHKRSFLHKQTLDFVNILFLGLGLHDMDLLR